MKFFITILKYILLSALLCNFAYAQNGKQKKEEINISSSFKPSIIKSSKIEFRPEGIARDTSAYKFKYEPVRLSFSTPMSGFTIKPLVYEPEELKLDSNAAFIQLGYGNLSSPQIAASLTRSKNNQFLSGHADYFSVKGKLLDQQHAIGTGGLTFKKRISETHQYFASLGIEDHNYRTYGFDRTVLNNISSNALKQHITKFNLQTSLTNVADEEGKLSVRPLARFQFLSNNKGFTNFETLLELPFEYKLKNNLLLNANPNLNLLHSKEENLAPTNAYILQFPIGVNYIVNQIKVDVNAQPVLLKTGFKLLPNLNIAYDLKEKHFRLSGGYRNQFEMNSFNRLFSLNPFILPFSNTPVYEKHAFYSGFNWYNSSGLQLSFEAAYVKHQNLALYVNSGFLGKDFATIFESTLKTIDFESYLTYRLDEKISLKSRIKWMIFQYQSNFEKPYGVLPFEMNSGAIWQPIKKLSIQLNTQIWAGSYAKSQRSPSVTKLKNAVDINVGIDYKFNENWAIWLDLNNIANQQYQRWNQYDSYGFNFRGGVKYAFGKTNR